MAVLFIEARQLLHRRMGLFIGYIDAELQKGYKGE